MWMRIFRSFEHLHRGFKQRGYVFDHTSAIILAWDWALCAFGTYSAVVTPTLLVFPAVQWTGHAVVDTCLDVFFVLDIYIKLCTAFREGGYVVYNRRKIFINYFSGAPDNTEYPSFLH